VYTAGELNTLVDLSQEFYFKFARTVQPGVPCWPLPSHYADGITTTVKADPTVEFKYCTITHESLIGPLVVSKTIQLVREYFEYPGYRDVLSMSYSEYDHPLMPDRSDIAHGNVQGTKPFSRGDYEELILGLQSGINAWDEGQNL